MSVEHLNRQAYLDQAQEALCLYFFAGSVRPSRRLLEQVADMFEALANRFTVPLDEDDVQAGRTLARDMAPRGSDAVELLAENDLLWDLTAPGAPSCACDRRRLSPRDALHELIDGVWEWAAHWYMCGLNNAPTGS